MRRADRSPLLLINHSLINFGHGRHTLTYRADERIHVFRFSKLPAHGSAYDGEFSFVGRQAMGLTPVPQLQTMLQMPEEFVSRCQFVEVSAADVPVVVEFLQ